jgi:hypothetical protein
MAARIAAADVDDLSAINMLYYDPSKLPSFSSLRCFAAVRKSGKRRVAKWKTLLRQDAYTLHKPARSIPTNPFTLNNVGNLWDLDLADMCSLASH